MKSRLFPPLWPFLLVLGTTHGGPRLVGSDNDDGGGVLGLAVTQLVKQHLNHCHLVLATPQNHSIITANLIRMMETGREGGVVVVVGEKSITPGPLTTTTTFLTLQQIREGTGVWTEPQTTCRVLLIDFTLADIERANSVFEWVALWVQPGTLVVGFGGPKDVTKLMLHPVLRNTREAVYLASSTMATASQQGDDEGVIVWRRCAYCADGRPGVELLGGWDLQAAEVPAISSVFREKPENYNGHMFRIVEKDYFPYTSLDIVSDNPGDVVYLKDALATRLIRAMASSLNFTFEVRGPADGLWGLEVEPGRWTGIVGSLQREDADFSLDLTVTPQRTKVIQFARTYVDESVVLLSSKPRPLPEYLSLIRPFEWEVWVVVGVSVAVVGAALWLLQKAWSTAMKGRNVFSITSSFFYGLGILLEDPPSDPPSNITGQMLVGWWLVACLVITSSYRSSLISHLIIQGKSPVINTVEELVGREGWTWGTRRMTGALKTVLSTSPDPAMQTLYKDIQAISIDDGMQQVLSGRFAYLYSTYYMRILVATRYTDPTGYSPIHISTAKYDLYTGNSFCIRPGAPFLRHLSLTLQRLMEGGLIAFWMDDVINTRVREEARRKKEKEKNNVNEVSVVSNNKDASQVVLGLDHLQGAFWILLLGHGLGCLLFFLEQFIRGRYV